MHRSSVRVWIVIAGLALIGAAVRVVADSDRRPDFGALVQSLLRDQSEELFGIGRPLDHSAVGQSTARASTRLNWRTG